MKKFFFFVLMFLAFSLSAYAQKHIKFVVMKDMGKAGKAAIDANSIKPDGNLVYFDLYIIDRSIDKNILYIFNKYQMNCMNGNWKIVEMYNMMKTGNKVDLEFARKEPFTKNANSEIYQKFVCRNFSIK